MEQTGLKMNVINEIIELARKYQMEKVILFGSRARGDYTRSSDIDLAVLGGDVVSFSIDVEESVSTLLTFDIVNLSSDVAEGLLESIKEEGLVLYEKI
ncbi:MAG: nucleotidyltransferase domain-containing protein [Lachnospiraceae bacterium]|nr:nucleotidyltransferase domain-containing protein [Lachnospiraceae bacterium]